MSDKKTLVKNALLLVAILGLFGACQNLATDVKKTFSGEQDTTRLDTSWVSLFNGKDTRGWHSYGKDSAGSAWQAKDSSLFLNASRKKGWQVRNGGDLVSDKAYENFDLKLEWKISKGGNSGIMIYVQDEPKKYEYPWYTGPEMQVADNQFNEDGKIKKHHAGDLYDLISSTPDIVKPYGEWNEVEIISIDGDL
ncbi:MAG: DUF1080 domain-containing protein, partial [Mucilaginibacter polytrichastri]|nr:DUF1080 domain-containing protein [Mucilaginibacter polytrichastri]